MMRRRQFLKFLGASVLSAGINSYVNNADVNEDVRVFEFLSGDIQKLYNYRALALLDRDIKSVDTFDSLIKKLDVKLKGDLTLTGLEGELVGTTIAYSRRFSRNEASLPEISEFSYSTSSKKEAYKKRVEELTKFTVYQDEEKFILSTMEDFWFLTKDDLEALNNYVFSVNSLEKKFNEEKISESLGISTTINNYSPHLDTVYNISCKENMDFEDLLSILTIESKGDIYSVSVVGALGSWQIMPYVARSFWQIM
mgnify:FL=1